MSNPTPAVSDLFDKVVNLCKRRGFVFPSAEIYGGFRSTYDYGPVGVLLLRNVKDAWWRSMVQLRHDVVGLDAAILSPPAIWEASGHLKNFTDPLVDCKVCRERFRLDKLADPEVCPKCGSKHSFTEARQFNLMFKTYAGPVEGHGRRGLPAAGDGPGHVHQLQERPGDLAQAPPFGIAQIGKSFRNEITPGNFVFRTREFEQMEMEYFVPPDEDRAGTSTGAPSGWPGTATWGSPSMLRLRAHDEDELSHYSVGTSDVEFLFPWGWDELEGIANRTDYDLRQHAAHSGERLEYFDQAAGERYVPHVIEPAAGATRTAMAFLMAAYDKEAVAQGQGQGEVRTVLRFHHRIAPYKVAGAAPVQEARAVGTGHRGARSAAAALHVRLRRDPGDRSATAARTSWARRSASRSTSTRSTTTP